MPNAPFKKPSKTGKKKSFYFRARKKFCPFCADKMDDIDYKDASRLRRFVSDKGKILPRRATGVCAKHQRALAGAVKRARVMALLPFMNR
jgi:small subunit ribosomal protein S18